MGRLAQDKPTFPYGSCMLSSRYLMGAIVFDAFCSDLSRIAVAATP